MTHGSTDPFVAPYPPVVSTIPIAEGGQYTLYTTDKPLSVSVSYKSAGVWHAGTYALDLSGSQAGKAQILDPTTIIPFRASATVTFPAADSLTVLVAGSYVI